MEYNSPETQLGLYCVRAVQGVRMYQGELEGRNRGIFDYLLRRGAAASRDPPPAPSPLRSWEELAPDLCNFIYQYVGQRYGETVNRDFFQAAYGNAGVLADKVASHPALQNDYERCCALYSSLAGGNLACLFQWLDFPVRTEAVESAFASLAETGRPRP